MASTITNISCYKFTPLDHLPELRAELLTLCHRENLKGTILLSKEGINLFIAGLPESVDRLVTHLKSKEGLDDIAPKYSLSAQQPFTRMLVRIKKEIIAFGIPGIDPAKYTSKKLAATTLKQWLDEGRALTLLDTRNDYEVKLGTFDGAKALHIDHFRQFPNAVANQFSPAAKDEPIVMFCTGGIRCEKAGPFMEREGFKNIFQLDGGILKYFEECGSAHYQGECFVFDHRVGLNPELQETSSIQCFACQAPLSNEDQNDPRFVPNISCPHCHAALIAKNQEQFHKQQNAMIEAMHPLPGSKPGFENRPIYVADSFDKWTLVSLLSTIFPNTSAEEWATLCKAKQFINSKGETLSEDATLKAGEQIYQRIPMPIEPDVNSDISLIYQDEMLVVVDKPANLPIKKEGVFKRNTLLNILHIAYRPAYLRTVNALKTTTAGLAIFGRTKSHGAALKKAFYSKSTARTWRVEVEGKFDLTLLPHQGISISILQQGATATLLEIQDRPQQMPHFEDGLRKLFPTDSIKSIQLKRLEWIHPQSKKMMVFDIGSEKDTSLS